MKLLFVAPEICTPWSEGRKKWVRDLVEEMSGADEVAVLTTVPDSQETALPAPTLALECRSKAGLLSALVRRLPGELRRHRPDAVCSFPYGTFRGVRGIANRTYMALVDRLSRAHGVPCLTLMYSIDQHATPRQLGRWVSHLAVGGHAEWPGHTVDPGIPIGAHTAVARKGDGPPTLLFLTGLWQASEQRVDYMLEERGLGTLLAAGPRLCEAGVRLIAGAPILADASCRDYLLSHPCNRWDPSLLELETMAPIPEVYGRADLFMFPYRREIGHFVPTSIVEAMLAGTPVAVSDLPMLQKIACDGRNALVFRNGDPDSLADVILDALAEPARLDALSRSALAYARERWDIARSAAQLRAALAAHTGPVPG